MPSFHLLLLQQRQQQLEAAPRASSHVGAQLRGVPRAPKVRRRQKAESQSSKRAAPRFGVVKPLLFKVRAEDQPQGPQPGVSWAQTLRSCCRHAKAESQVICVHVSVADHPLLAPKSGKSQALNGKQSDECRLSHCRGGDTESQPLLTTGEPRRGRRESTAGSPGRPTSFPCRSPRSPRQRFAPGSFPLPHSAVSRQSPRRTPPSAPPSSAFPWRARSSARPLPAMLRRTLLLLSLLLVRRDSAGGSGAGEWGALGEGTVLRPAGCGGGRGICGEICSESAVAQLLARTLWGAGGEELGRPPQVCAPHCAVAGYPGYRRARMSLLGGAALEGFLRASQTCGRVEGKRVQRKKSVSFLHCPAQQVARAPYPPRYPVQAHPSLPPALELAEGRSVKVTFASYPAKVLSCLPKARNSHGPAFSSNADGRECNMTQQAACGDRCIPVAWLCNGEQECPDGTDEQCEEPCGGHLQAWQCDDGTCIAISWLCDGAGDCLDGSDEVNCERMTACPEQKVQCPGMSQCLDTWELCDVYQDCEDGSNKEHCPQSHCLAGQWQCQNKLCVMDSWKCDGVDHCGDSSDEEDCALCPEGTVRCDEGKCVRESSMCDGKADCTDGADEPATCGKNCSVVNAGCEGLCSDTAWGARCSCGSGWQLQPDGRSCADVDECSMAFGPCDQLCHNTPGSYSCDCVQGYKLYNGSKCRVTDGDVKILIAADQALGVLDQRTGIYESLIPTRTRPSSVAYDLERSTYFWVDKTLNVFVSGKPNFVLLYPELTTVNSISLDWFTGQLYWASSFARAICAGLSDGRGYVKILEKDIVPEQLVVFPAKKYLYWVNGGEKGRSTIETAGMDGSDRKVLEVVTTQQPLGLTLDHVTGRLYWISGYKQSIETVKVDGSGRYSFPKNLEDEDPVGLAVFENSFFWASKTQLFHTSLYGPEERRVLLDASISAFSVLHRSLQPPSRPPACVPGVCSHLCLLSPVHPKGSKCVCPEGMFLLPSGTCSELKLVISSGKRLYLLKVGSMGSAIERTLIQEHPGNVYLLDIDWKRNFIYWTNAQGHLVYSTGYSGQKQEIWTQHTVCSANVDIPTGNVYWLPCDRSAIQKTTIPGADTKSLYRTGGIILQLLLDWPRRALYWVESSSHLQSMTLDGRNRQAVWRGTWTADIQMALDLSSASILWTSKGLGLQSLSLLKNRTYSLNKSWSDGLIAAHTPYLVTIDKAALVLWNRKTLEPFSVLKEPHIRKMVILAENQEVPDPEDEGAAPAALPAPPLLCAPSSVPCREEKKCISLESLCDGEHDCQDGSDEENCAQICHKPGFFQCLDGSRCLEGKFHCDGAQQCPDGSDEVACWKPTEDCSLHCDEQTRCIPKSWLCDGNLDCSDKKDEEGCIHENCSTSEFNCKSGQCVSYSLHCDGNPDCLDHSDEEGCPAARPPWCPMGEVKCRSSGECVLAEWLCDHDLDCKDGSDEKDCDPEALRCSPRQWACASRDQCVPDFWHCDGERDCRDGSDEAGCPPQKCWGSEFQCGTSICLNFSLVCDGKEDCADSSDEGGRCQQSACSPGQCPHTCYPSPAGPVCACEPGFELESSRGICEDVDECQGFGSQPCSHTCINTKGSYICTCHPGYSLEPDGHTCKATGTEPILIVAVQSSLFLYGLRSLKEDILATIDKNLIIFSVDYDLVDQKVFWADFNAESIQWISMDTTKKGTVVKGIKSDCIAVDWIGRNLYWTDGTAGQILAIPLTAVWRGKSEYTIVLDDDLTQPRSLALDPLNGLMYWSEIGEKPQIEKAGMDGSSRKILIDQGLGRPSSITLDQLSWKIFWSDDKFHSIGSANLDGTGVSMLQLTQIKNPFSVTVFEDEVFWSEMKTRTVQRVRKMTGKNRAVLIKRSGQPYGLKIMHEVLQPRSLNPCLDTRCSHLCLLSPRSKGSCHCPVGFLLADDGLNCVPLRESAFIFLVLPTVITQIYLKNLKALPRQATLPEHKILPFTNVNQLASVDYLVQEKALYLSELNNGDIRLLRLEESGTLSWRKLISVEGSVIDLAVDWLSGNIYWIDSENPHINVASSKGQYAIVLLRENLSHPSSIVLHPPAAAMCFVDLGPWNDGSHESSIECAAMDGSGRKVLWQKSQVPVGLAFSDSGTRLYWADSAQITKVWYSKTEVSENWWFQIDQKIVDLKVYSSFNQQGNNSCSKDNGGCSHICLPNPKGQTCKCPSGYYLADANKCIEAIQCSVSSLPCKDGQKCISMEQVCDGHSDCLDGSDEMHCEPCSSAFCNGRGTCTVEGKLRKCSCLTDHGREFCEEAQNSVPGYIALSITMAFSLVLVALGTLTYFRRVHELKRRSSRNLACDKEHNQEEENLMNSEIFVNEAYDEQELLTSLRTD
ncbi:prolow-density lipoprotein receptor-related protein 1-like [Erethizon dorsatum]